MGGFEIDLNGWMASIDALVAAVDTATRTGVSKGASLIEATAKSNFGPVHAKGTPKTSDKPQSISGTLRRSIRRIPLTPVSIGRNSWMQSVAPTVIYGRRIELGFTGVDSLGRHYPGINPPGPGDPPYPYMQPAIDRSIPQLQRIFTSTWQAAFKGS